MTELLEELEVKRERENAEAERHRRRRDELNDQTREWVNRRDELNEEVRKALEELHDAKEKAEAAHAVVGKLAEEAQKEHDTMTELYERSDELRRQADLAQEEFIKTKMAADEEHRKHIDRIRQVHDYDKIIHGIRLKSYTEEPGAEGRVRVQRQT